MLNRSRTERYEVKKIKDQQPVNVGLDRETSKAVEEYNHQHNPSQKRLTEKEAVMIIEKFWKRTRLEIIRRKQQTTENNQTKPKEITVDDLKQQVLDLCHEGAALNSWIQKLSKKSTELDNTKAQLDKSHSMTIEELITKENTLAQVKEHITQINAENAPAVEHHQLEDKLIQSLETVRKALSGACQQLEDKRVQISEHITSWNTEFLQLEKTQHHFDEARENFYKKYNSISKEYESMQMQETLLPLIKEHLSSAKAELDTLNSESNKFHKEMFTRKTVQKFFNIYYEGITVKYWKKQLDSIKFQLDVYGDKIQEQQEQLNKQIETNNNFQKKRKIYMLRKGKAHYNIELYRMNKELEEKENRLLETQIEYHNIYMFYNHEAEQFKEARYNFNQATNNFDQEYNSMKMLENNPLRDMSPLIEERLSSAKTISDNFLLDDYKEQLDRFCSTTQDLNEVWSYWTNRGNIPENCLIIHKHIKDVMNGKLSEKELHELAEKITEYGIDLKDVKRYLEKWDNINNRIGSLFDTSNPNRNANLESRQYQATYMIMDSAILAMKAENQYKNSENTDNKYNASRSLMNAIDAFKAYATEILDLEEAKRSQDTGASMNVAGTNNQYNHIPASSQKSGADPLVNPGQKDHDESPSANLPQNIEKIHIPLSKFQKEMLDFEFQLRTQQSHPGKTNGDY